MAQKNRFVLLIVILLTALLLVGGIFVITNRRPASDATPTALVDNEPPGASTESPPPDAQDVIARVNNQAVYRTTWETSLAMETVLNQLADQPPPTAETTLERMINQIVVLQSAETVPKIDSTQVDVYIEGLSTSWGISTLEIDSLLAQNGLTHEDLENEITRVLQVNAIIDQLDGGGDPNTWVAGRRGAAQVSILTTFETAAAVVPPIPSPTVGLPAASGEATEAADVSGDAPETTTEDNPLAAGQPAEAPEVETGVQPGFLAPDFSLQTPDGETVSLQQYRGQVVVLNFWATWCPICRQELPDLEAAHREFQQQGVVLLSVDQQEAPEKVAAFMAENDLSYPTVIDPKGEVGRTYQVVGIPTTLIIDRDGVIQTRHIGPLTQEQFRDYVTPYLEQASQGTTGAAEAGIQKMAPDFTLPDSTGVPVSLRDYQGKWVALVFYRGKT